MTEVKMTFSQWNEPMVYSVISSLKAYYPTSHFTPLVSGPVHSCAISTPRGAYSHAAIMAH